jgi:hypothetical protein
MRKRLCARPSRLPHVDEFGADKDLGMVLVVSELHRTLYLRLCLSPCLVMVVASPFVDGNAAFSPAVGS